VAAKAAADLAPAAVPAEPAADPVPAAAPAPRLCAPVAAWCAPPRVFAPVAPGCIPVVAAAVSAEADAFSLEAAAAAGGVGAAVAAGDPAGYGIQLGAGSTAAGQSLNPRLRYLLSRRRNPCKRTLQEKMTGVSSLNEPNSVRRPTGPLLVIEIAELLPGALSSTTKAVPMSSTDPTGNDVVLTSGGTAIRGSKFQESSPILPIQSQTGRMRSRLKGGLRQRVCCVPAQTGPTFP
jgi:hypothetical protein